MSSSHRDEPRAIDAETATAVAVMSEEPSRCAAARAKVRRFVRREHAPVSLRWLLTKALVNAAVVPVFVGTFAVSATMPPFLFVGPGHEPPQSGGPLTVEAVVMDLIEEHGCWMGAAPQDMEGRRPGHAVITWPGEEGPVYGGPRAVTAGLEHRFEGKHESLLVHAFCR